MHEEAKQIPLRRRGQGIVAYALVDPEDFERFGDMRWHIHTGYARHSLADGRCLYLHRLVLGLGSLREDPRRVDHINRDRLDSRRENLRIATHFQNMQNLPSRRESTSTYRGVSLAAKAKTNVWRAEVFLDGSRILDRHYRTEIEAAVAAEKARLAHAPFAVPDPRLAGLCAATSQTEGAS